MQKRAQTRSLRRSHQGQPSIWRAETEIAVQALLGLADRFGHHLARGQMSGLEHLAQVRVFNLIGCGDKAAVAIRDLPAPLRRFGHMQVYDPKIRPGRPGHDHRCAVDQTIFGINAVKPEMPRARQCQVRVTGNNRVNALNLGEGNHRILKPRLSRRLLQPRMGQRDDQITALRAQRLSRSLGGGQDILGNERVF